MRARFSSACKPLALLAVALTTACAADWEAGPAPGVRFNEIQVVGTHNSYHLAPSAEETAWRQSALVRQFSPALAALATDYSHASLTEQLKRLGVRQLELDVYPAEADGEFPVRHVPIFDERSTVPTLGAALREIRAWSRAHPRHVPVMVQIELKTRRFPAVPPEQIADPELRARWTLLPHAREWDAAQLAALDAAICTVFAEEALITPDLVRGDAPTLRESVLTRGWPLLDAVRGRVMFCLDNEGELRDRYLGGASADRCGRVLFVSVPPEHPAAAWQKVNDPVQDFARIQDLVRRGFLVRTRADEELREAKASDPTRCDRAFASGAQFVSTDFPAPDPRWPGYAVRFAGGAAIRMNPLGKGATPHPR